MSIVKESAASLHKRKEPMNDNELPGMWSESDFTGGATDCEQRKPPTPKEYFTWCKGPFAWMFGNSLMVIGFHDGSVWEKGPFGLYFRIGIDDP